MAVTPTGGQRVYVEKPYQVYAEQYFAATVPPIAGVCRCSVDDPSLNPAFPEPHAHPGKWAYLHDTDWILTSKYSGLIVEVVSDAEFQERFGGSELTQEAP